MQTLTFLRAMSRAIVETCRRPLWIAAAVAPFLFIAIVNHLVRSDTGDQHEYRIARVGVSKADSNRADQPPRSEWRDVKLPHQPMGQSQHSYAVWYRIDVDVQ